MTRARLTTTPAGIVPPKPLNWMMPCEPDVYARTNTSTNIPRTAARMLQKVNLGFGCAVTFGEMQAVAARSGEGLLDRESRIGSG